MDVAVGPSVEHGACHRPARISNVVLTPTYGTFGASFAVAVADLFWLAAIAVVLARLSGLLSDVSISWAGMSRRVEHLA
jgi:hypothetical protein